MLKKIKNILKNDNTAHLITQFNPLKLNSNTNYAKHLTFTTSDYSQELLDNPQKPINTFEVYFDCKKKQDTLIFNTSNIKCNLLTIYPKLIGRELNKTCSFKTSYKGKPKDCIFEIISGNGYFILENLNNTKDIKLVKVTKNTLVLIPSNYSFTIINTSSEKNLLCICLIGKRTKLIHNTLTSNNGNTLYYLKTGFIKNQNALPTYNLENIDGNYFANQDFTQTQELYKEFIESPEKFNFLK